MKRFLRSAVFSAVLLLILPVSTHAARTLIPVGRVIGLQLQDDTVIVAAFENEECAAKAAGLRVGDQILQINGLPIRCTEDVRAVLDCCGDQISMTIRRGCRQNTLVFSPEATESGHKLGVYLRQGIAGIGTVTYYDPETGRFGTLGHGVSDPKGTLLPMKRGAAYEAGIASVVPGKSGEPGQLKGQADADHIFGQLLQNTPQGVFGQTATGWPGEPMCVASPEEISTGTATIRSTETILLNPILSSFIPDHSTFCTCSRIFSISLLAATTNLVIWASDALEPMVFTSLFNSCTRKSSRRPTSPLPCNASVT